MWPLPGGAGIGERLLREVARRGQANGYTHLRLTVDDGNAGGAKFYHGWVSRDPRTSMCTSSPATASCASAIPTPPRLSPA